ALTVQGDRMIADFTGASPQVPFPVNSTAAVSAAGVLITVKSVFDPQAPLNQGSFRPIEVITPPGSIVNVQRPAPAGSHGEIRKRVIATMVGALAQMVPDKIAGDLCRTSFHNLIGGFDNRTGREWVHYEWSAGGNGAFAEDDGPSAIATIDWGDLVTVQSSEVIETRMPLLVESSRLAPDSGGAGTTRGGLSMQRALRVLAADARYSLLSDGAVVPAFGVLGGLSGVPVGAWVDRDGAIQDFDTPGKIAGHPVDAGDIIMVRSAGGGGYGDPLERDPQRVATDLREGYISAAQAHQLYGLVLDKANAVDKAATAAWRERLRAGRTHLSVRLEANVFEKGAISQRRIYRLNPADARAAGIGEDDVVELDSSRAAPLRAWARLDAGVRAGTVGMDARGLTILKATEGERLQLRAVAASVRPRSGFATTEA
ncbi:MAG: hydantoinase B/oxoprolinase family protein, partial [Hyphomicrobiaceae bacterium]